MFVIKDLGLGWVVTLYDIKDLGPSLTFFVQMRHAASETGCVNIVTGKLRPKPNFATIVCATLLRKLVLYGRESRQKKDKKREEHLLPPM